VHSKKLQFFGAEIAILPLPHCVVPENIHTPPPRMVNENSEGVVGLIGGNFRGVGECPYEEFVHRVMKFVEKS